MLFHFHFFNGDQEIGDVITELEDEAKAIFASLKWAIDWARSVPIRSPRVQVYTFEIGKPNPSGYIRKHKEALVWSGKEVRSSPHIRDMVEFRRLMADLRGAFEIAVQKQTKHLEKWEEEKTEEKKADARTRIRVESVFRPYVAELLNKDGLYTVQDVVAAARSFNLQNATGIGPEIEAEIAKAIEPYI